MEAKTNFRYLFEKNPVDFLNPQTFSTPSLVAYYQDNDIKTEPGKKILYFHEPKRSQYPLDLKIGYEKYKARKSPMYKKYINLSLEYAMTADEAGDHVDQTMVYTRRGTLAHLMETCYVDNKHDKLSVRVSRFNDNIFMVQEEQDESKFKKPISHTHHNRLEKVLFAESPFERPKTIEPCDENERFVAVHRSTLGKFNIAYSGEVQGIIAEEKFTDFDDINALNDCRFVLTKQMWEKFRYNEMKTLNYWLQAYLANVHDIYFAYKHGEGIVREPIVHKTVSDLPKNCSWKPKVCIGFLQYFLEGIEKIMCDVNSLNTVYVFGFNPFDKKITYKIFEGETDKTFISKEYKEFIKN